MDNEDTTRDAYRVREEPVRAAVAALRVALDGDGRTSLRKVEGRLVHSRARRARTAREALPTVHASRLRHPVFRGPRDPHPLSRPRAPRALARRRPDPDT